MVVVGLGRGASAGPYDPLRVGEPGRTLDLVLSDPARERDVPLRVYLPADASPPAAVVLFSHGLGGSSRGSRFLGEHWSGRGYVAVFLQHPGSDEGIWRDAPLGRRLAAMTAAANGENLLLRVDDVKATLDALERWNVDPASPLHGRLDLARIGMSGHSFGAVTTQAVSGQRFPAGRIAADPRIKAAVVFSPSVPRAGSAERAFGGVTLPWLLMTGTHDVSPIGGIDVADRLAVFPSLPVGDKYELVLDGAQHSAFTDRPTASDGPGRNPHHHRSILAVSTAFWDAHLRGDDAAKAWINGPDVRAVLDPDDRWQTR